MISKACPIGSRRLSFGVCEGFNSGAKKLDTNSDFEDERITKDIYDKKHQDYADKLQLLEIELSEHRTADYDYQTTVASVLSVARRAKDIFNSSETHEKRAFLNYLIQNPTVNEKTLGFTLRSPYNLVLELADRPNWLWGLDDVRTCLIIEKGSKYEYLCPKTS